MWKTFPRGTLAEYQKEGPSAAREDRETDFKGYGPLEYQKNGHHKNRGNGCDLLRYSAESATISAKNSDIASRWRGGQHIILRYVPTYTCICTRGCTGMILRLIGRNSLQYTDEFK